MFNILSFDKEARDKVLSGVSTVYRAVSSTLGPKATNVAIDRPYGAPMVVHDGVTVSKSIDKLEDPFENMGAQLVKEAAEKTNDAVGDGTTTSIVLAHAIASEANENIVAGANPMMIRRGIEKAVEKITDALEALAIPISSKEEVQQVATVSAQDDEIGELVATAVDKMGKNGVITVEESGAAETSIEYKQGMEFDRGFPISHFITNPQLMEAVVDNPYILVTDIKIKDTKDFIEFLDKFFAFNPQNGAPERNDLVIISGSLEDQALAILAQNKIQGRVRALAVTAPSHGEQQKGLLEDIAIITGAEFISGELGAKLGPVTFEQLGHAKRVVATRDSTLIVDGEGEPQKRLDRIIALEESIEKATKDYDRDRLQERLAKLTSGIAIINVGAFSETEMKEKKERVIDAISATRAAQEGGIVPGGETALIRAASVLKDLVLPDQEMIGVKIVKKAIEKPFRKLMENAGYDSGKMLNVLEEAILDDKKPNLGIDVIDGSLKDMVKSGIIDPVKVTKSALKNGSSVAVMLMTTNVLITSKNEPSTGGES